MSLAERGAIYGAPAVRDAPSAQAAALTHVSTTESWFAWSSTRRDFRDDPY
jgi:hypothetical protein